MSSPDYELVRAAMDALRADTMVASFIDMRIYDRPPQKPEPAFPYITVGPTSSIPDDADCSDAEEITIQLDVWSQGANEAYSSAECRRLIDAVKQVLHDADLTLADNALVTIQMSLKQIVREPDGITSHGILQFTATVETT